MTATERALREEAEKVAAEVADCPRKGDPCEACRDNATIIADALVAFVEKHGARERLRGRIEQLGDDNILAYRYCQDYIAASEELRVKQNELRAQLAAMEKGEEVAG